MVRRHYVPLRRGHNIPIRSCEDAPLRRRDDVPLRRRWVFHFRRTCDVAGTYKETSLRRRYDVLLTGGLLPLDRRGAVHLALQNRIFFVHTLLDFLQDVRDSGIFLAIDVNVNLDGVVMDITSLSSIEHDISTDYAHSHQNMPKRSQWWLTSWWCCHRRCLNRRNRNWCQSLVFVATDMKNWTICVIVQQKDSCLIAKFCLPIVGQEYFPGWYLW